MKEDPILKGELTEERALDTLLRLKERIPHFVRGFRRSAPELDARGIDLLVEIALPPGSAKRTMTVPLEIKSSMHGVRKWKVVHRDLHDAGVLVIAVPESPRKAIRLMYRALQRVQKNSQDGTLYHSLFQRIFKGGSRNLQRIIEMIRLRRSEKK